MLILRDFDLSTPLNANLFSTEVPEGYTLGNDSESSGTLNGQARADRARQRVALNWDGQFRFAPDQHLFVLSEKEFISLLENDRRQISESLMEQLSHVRAFVKELLRRGQTLAENSSEDRGHTFICRASLNPQFSRHLA